MTHPKIIVVGSSNTDMVVKSQKLPAPGETVTGGEFLLAAGGKGANQAVAAARLGGNVTFIAKTGNDVFGQQSIQQYNAEGICTDYIFSDPEHPSGVALIAVDANGENSILVASGANGTLSVEDIETAKNEIETAGIVLMQLEIPIETVEYAAGIASQNQVQVILNPAPAQSLSDWLLQHLYIITPNKTEAERLTGITVNDWESAQSAADCLSEKGVEIVIITLGAEGALVKEGNQYHRIASEKVKAVDTTAAGDTFNGALCVGLSEGLSVVEAVKMACKASAIAVTRLGAQSSIPHRKELEN